MVRFVFNIFPVAVLPFVALSIPSDPAIAQFNSPIFFPRLFVPPLALSAIQVSPFFFPPPMVSLSTALPTPLLQRLFVDTLPSR